MVCTAFSFHLNVDCWQWVASYNSHDNFSGFILDSLWQQDVNFQGPGSREVHDKFELGIVFVAGDKVEFLPWDLVGSNFNVRLERRPSVFVVNVNGHVVLTVFDVEFSKLLVLGVPYSHLLQNV